MLRGVERHGEEKLVKRVYWVVVEDDKGIGRPQRRWRDEVKESLLAICRERWLKVAHKSG